MRAIDAIFQDRTCYKFADKKIEKKLLVQIYDSMKYGPTSGNSSPLRIIFVQSKDEKAELCKLADKGNIDKIYSAPVTAIFAYDTNFYEKMNFLNPVSSFLKDYFTNNQNIANDSAYRNSTLQAAYFMMVARGLGLACGPMSGFNADKLNETFFKESGFKVNFICNLGYAADENPYQRLPRFDFDQVCKII